MDTADPEILSQFYALEDTVRRSLEVHDYEQAKAGLEQMQDVIQTHPEGFEEAEDRVRVLGFRRAMVSYRQARAVGGSNVIGFLREAAALSMPSVCAGTSCETLDPQQCLIKSSTLSQLQARMCVERINATCTAHKIESAIAARDFRYQEALNGRRAAVTLHRHLLVLDSPERRQPNQDYLEYWQSVTEGYVALLEGDFAEAGKWFQVARLKGVQLDQERCFPNYFRTVEELGAYPDYIKATEDVRNARFGEARDRFRTWIRTVGRDMAVRLRYDNACLLAEFCDALDILDKAETAAIDWAALERDLERSYTARTTWALWARLQWLRELAFHKQRGDAPPDAHDLTAEVRKLADNWSLFVPDAVLLGEDRTAGLRRPVTVPSFLDISPYVDSTHPRWGETLLQSARNLLLLLADYERLRFRSSSGEPSNRPPSPEALAWTETCPLTDLAAAISACLSSRSESHQRIFDRSLTHLEKLKAGVAAGNFGLATAAWGDLLHGLRLWPHVIYVQEQKTSARLTFIDESSPELPLFWTKTTRLWNCEPKEMVIEIPEKLRVGSHYYLRPRWNVRAGDQYRLRHEQFLRATVVRPCVSFFRGVVGKTEVAGDRFSEWLFQFSEEERLLACRLFSGLVFYDEEKTRQVWRKAFKKLPEEAMSDVAYVGLGHGAKSGGLCRYSFRQAVTDLPEYATVFAGEEKRIFRDLAEFEKPELGLIRPRVIVFLDDFVGTGGQAKKFLEWYFPKYPWLERVSVYLCVLVGFRTALRTLGERLKGKVKGIIAGEVLEEDDRAFDPQNPIWNSAGECSRTLDWASKIGRDLLATCSLLDDEGKILYPAKRDALGWHGCQALITFHHNVPSDTLPLFWAHWPRDEQEWMPLLKRHD